VVEIQRQERNENETLHTRTLTEAKSMKPKTPRSPPEHYEQFKKYLATHAMMVLALCGDNCDYYQKLWELHRVLDMLEFKQGYCNKMLWRYLTWIIIDDQRQYFSKCLALEDFAGKSYSQIDWPTSLLGLTCQDLARLRDIRPGDFPRQWDDNNGRRTDQSSFSTRTHNGGGTGGYHGGNNTHQQQQQHRNAAGKDAEGWNLNMHPLIQRLMTRYRTKYNWVNMKEILNAAGKTFNDLPCPQRYMRNGRCGLCMNNTLGKCTVIGCEYVHAEQEELGDQYHRDLHAVIEPGVEKILQPGYQRPNPNKRQRRSN